MPSPAPIAERIDQTQRGSSKRYSSQRQRNVPEGPGYQEGSGVQSPGAQGPMVPPQAQGPPPPSQGAVQVPKLSEPAFFNPGMYVDILLFQIVSLEDTLFFFRSIKGFVHFLFESF